MTGGIAKRKVPIFRLNEAVHVETTAGSTSFSTCIVGVKPDVFLILEHPHTETDAPALRPQDIVGVRCPQNDFLQFTSKVIQVLEDPIPLIFVQYPRFAEGTNQRRDERKMVFIRGEFQKLHSNVPGPFKNGYLLNISESGCLMWSNAVEHLDQEVLLAFRIPWCGTAVRARARVVRCEVTDGGVKSGLEFVELRPEARMEIRQLLQSLDERQLCQFLIDRGAN